MRFSFKDRNNQYVKTVTALASKPAIMDSELGYAHWFVAKKFLYPYIPEFLKPSFENIRTLAEEFGWMPESIMSTYLFEKIILVPDRHEMTARKAFALLSPNLGKTLLLPWERDQWEFKALTLVYASCDVSCLSVGEVAEVLCRSLLDSNEAFSRYLSA